MIVNKGFGGGLDETYRLWIDENIIQKSYVTVIDEVYKDGCLISSSNTNLNIIDVEVWGLGNENDLRN